MSNAKKRPKKSSRLRTLRLFKRVGVGFEQLEERRLLTCSTRIAVVISGFGGADYPPKVMDELVSEGFTGIGSGVTGIQSNWNSVVPNGAPGGFSAGITVETTHVHIPGISVSIGGKSYGVPDVDVDFPKRILISAVDLGTPDSSQQIVDKVVTELAKAEYADPDAEIVIIGHSLGGDTALKIAQSTNRQIDLLALLDPVGFVPGIANAVQTVVSPPFSILGFGTITPPDISIQIPKNSANETPGFFTGSNLSNSAVPSNVGYFYNRWQSNDLFPLDFAIQDRTITSHASVSDQRSQNTKEPYYLTKGGPLNRLAILAPDRIDFNPFGTREITVLGQKFDIPTTNDNFLKTDAQLHHDFPQNDTVQSELINILRSLDDRQRPDGFEANNSIGTATPIPPSGTLSATGLTIHTTSDVDFFKLLPQKPGLVQSSISFCGLDGELRFDVVDGSGKLVVGSISNGDPTNSKLSLAFAAVEGGEYYLRVRGNGSSVNEYDLSVQTLSINAPNFVDLLPSSDSGRSHDDNVTANTFLVTVIQDDLRDFGAAGLILGPGSGGPGVQVVQIVSNASTGAIVSQKVASRAGGVSNYLFNATVSNLSDGNYVFSAFSRLFDGSGGFVDSQLSPPITVTIDSASPVLVRSPDLLSTSDSGYSDSDNITNVAAPTFVGFGSSEPDSIVKLFADGNLVGQGFANTDGNWQVQVNPLVNGTHTIQVTYEDVAGNTSIVSQSLRIIVDLNAPSFPFLALASDSGRSNIDNVTMTNRPKVSLTANETKLGGSNPTPNRIVYRIYDRPGDASSDGEYLAIDSSTLLGGFSDRGFFTNFLTRSLNNPLGTPLPDGFHNLRVEVEDEAGNLSHSDTLAFFIDTVNASGFFGFNTAADSIQGLDSASDSGIEGFPSTFFDRITKVTAPTFFGRAEADSIVRLYVESNGTAGLQSSGANPDLFIGLTTTVPSDGNAPYSGQWKLKSDVDLNNSSLGFPRDGERRIYLTTEDVSGNVLPDALADSLDVLIDTSAARVSAISFPNGTTVFATKPNLTPSPATSSLLVTYTGGPSPAAGLSTPAVDEGQATDVRNYRLVGDQSGVILIGSVSLVDSTAGALTVRLNFSSPLPDDRFTLIILDTVSDASGNLLDGESQASAPGGASLLLPSGNGISGGNFSARFTVDSRPEFGTVSQGLAYVDINGNFEWDPSGSDNDATNRDFVFQMGTLTDAHFAGNFSATGAATASGFDKLGVYGKFGGTYSFLIDTNDDGVGDLASVMPASYQVNGIPVAGNFNDAHPGDEIGLFDGQFWYLDTNGNNQLDLGEKIQSNCNGLPLVGDFDGNGQDDLATYVNDTNTFYFDMNRNGTFDSIWEVRDTVKRFAGLSGFTDRPVVGDLNLDGVDDIGLWVKGRSGQLPVEAGEFFFWVSDRKAATPTLVFDSYSPAPLGNDLFAQFGDENALPVFGNFDPPIGDVIVPPATENFLHRKENALDVDGDNFVSPLDALLIVNSLNLREEIPWSDPVRGAASYASRKIDTNGDGVVSPLDALMVINSLNSRGGGGEGEGNIDGEKESFPVIAKSNAIVDGFFASLGNEEIDLAKKRRR